MRYTKASSRLQHVHLPLSSAITTCCCVVFFLVVALSCCCCNSNVSIAHGLLHQPSNNKHNNNNNNGTFITSKRLFNNNNEQQFESSTNKRNQNPISRMKSGMSSTTTQRGGGGGGGVLVSKQQQQQQKSPSSNRKYTISILNNNNNVNETPPAATTIQTKIRPIPPSPLLPSSSLPVTTTATTTTNNNNRNNNSNKLSRIDIFVGIAYFCNMFTITLPIILIPIIGQQQQQNEGGFIINNNLSNINNNNNNDYLSSFVGRVASIAIMGGGVGKIINGLICQKLGGITTASTYLIGLGICSLALSLSSSSSSSFTTIPWLVAGMEFFSSAMWVACSVILSNYHHNQNHLSQNHHHQTGNSSRRRHRPSLNNNKVAAMKFARGITFLSLSSTIAQLSSKMIGSVLLKVMDWRQVAQIGSVLTIIGSIIIQTIVAKDITTTTTKLKSKSKSKPTTTERETRIIPFQKQLLRMLPLQKRRQQQLHSSSSTTTSSSSTSSTSSSSSVIRKTKSVISSKLFWLVGIAHVSGFLARTSDRMMGPFLRDVTGLSYHICGGLTASITIGFALGVMRANSFFKLDTIDKKNRQLMLWYGKAIVALFGLILVGNDSIRTSVITFLGNNNNNNAGRIVSSSSLFRPNILLALWVITCSGILASSVAFQFYQVPSIVSTVAFNENKAICLSFLEGLAFFLSAPLWAMSSHLVETVGWSASWTFVTVAFGLGASLMMHTLQPVLKQQQQQQQQHAKT